MVKHFANLKMKWNRMIELDKLFLQIPDGEGNYHQQSVQDILDSQDPFGIAVLREWFANHVFTKLGWSEDDISLTEETVRKALSLMDDLKIKPVDCFYLGNFNER